MALHHPRHTSCASRRRALTLRELKALGRRAASAALALLALLTFAQSLRAQSGRNKQPAGKTSTGQTRPKRVNDSQQPQPAPARGLPPGSVVLDEAPPPPPPTPTPTPTPVDEEVGAEDIVRITSNLVTVPASVVDAQGRAVIDLQLEDFELRVDGQPRPISELSRSEVPVTLALLFDNSSSLSAAREFEKQAAVKFFRSVIRPIDRAAIYSVDTEITLAQPLTNNVQALVRTIEHFGKPEGATRLLDAIVEAATYLRPYPGRKVIVIVSDGEDTLSDAGFDDALRKALASDCQVYAVQTKQIEYVMLTGERANANLQALAAERRMQDLTAHTGGAVYTPLQTSDLDRAFAQISADLSQQYILSYYPTDERLDGRFRTISVRVSTRPNMRVRARRGYYPRRPNERVSFNTEPPVHTQPPANDSLAPPVESNNLPSIVSNITAPQKTVSVPVRSNRRGPSESGDESEVLETVDQPARIEKPSVKESEPTLKAATPVAQPKPAPDSTASDPANARPAAAHKPPAPPVQTPTSLAQKPISGGVLNGRAVSLPMPQYPPDARRARAYGVVTVEVLLDVDGKVISARALDGHPLLRQAAVDAARQARFSPTVLSGRPVQVAGTITYKFNLN